MFSELAAASRIVVKVERGDTHTHHQLFHGGVLFALARRVVVLVHDLHPDVVLGRHGALQVWRKGRRGAE